MATTLQIRNVPDEIHAAVRVRAAQAGLSVSDYLLDLVRELVTRPTMAEIVARAKTLAQAGGGASRAEVQAAVRSGRDR
jgi:plasmid stability protein